MIENVYKKIMMRQKNINKSNLVMRKFYIKRGLHKTCKKKENIQPERSKKERSN